MQLRDERLASCSQKGRTVMFATHDVDEAVRHASRKILTSAEIASFTRGASVERWLGDSSKLFVEFGTIKDPLPPSGYLNSRLVPNA